MLKLLIISVKEKEYYTKIEEELEKDKELSISLINKDYAIECEEGFKHFNH